MNKSIFKRYLTVTMIIILISFIILGSMMMVFFSSYWKEENKKVLESNANSVAIIAGETFSSENEEVSNRPARYALMKVIVSTTARNINSDIIITDPVGDIIYSECENSKKSEDEVFSIKEDIVLKALEGRYEDRGDLDGFYKSDYFVIGVPMQVSRAGKIETVGAVFVATSASPMNAFLQKTIEIFLLASVMALVISFFFVGFYSYSFVKPLRDMNIAVKAFGDGDLSVRMNVTSDDEIGRLAASFNEMANSISNSEGVRRSFIANVSHELKTPMTTIGGFIDGILDGTIPSELQSKYLKIVSEEVKRLSRLVKSMLDLSRIDSGELKLTLVDFNLTETISKVLLIFTVPIEEKNIEILGLENVGREIVRGDEDLLHQVVYNLIENAVKFTNPDGHIRFIITDSIDRVSVAIENSGEGIEPEDLQMIFERFYKTDKSRSKDKNGMGLGLYLVRTIIKLHGGDIFASSIKGEYTRFEFYIPKPTVLPKVKRGIDEDTVLDADIIDPHLIDVDMIDVEATEIGEESKLEEQEDERNSIDE